jgi:iron(II)-dependent oxidoreductase
MVASMGDGQQKPMYPWGDDLPTGDHANLDGAAVGCIDVAACPQGDSASGCRQLIGNVWEWTASAFYPFPGYVVDRPYREYSAPWFGHNKVLRGGCWATRSRLIRNTYRNFCLPHRRDTFSGFRTCAAHS